MPELPHQRYMSGKEVSGYIGGPKKGKEVVDIQVENALLKRALGYSYKETKTEGNGPMEIRSQSQSRRLYQIPLHRYSGLRTGGQISGGISRTLSTVDR